jgi:glycosyltransferase involved in cell wall biosynthesis
VSSRDGGRLVLVSGRDPLRTSGGSESYVVAHARAARAVGYEPHVFSIAPRSAVLETDFGLLHRVASPVRPPRSITSVLQRPWLVPALVRFLKRSPGPHVLHAYGAWADPVLAAARRLQRRGVQAIPVATVFMAIEHETTAKLTSRIVQDSPSWLGVHRLELGWVKHVTRRVEGRAYRRLPMVIVNYESVRTALHDAYGPGLPIRRLTYSPPTALHDPPESQGPPPPLAQLGDAEAPLIVSVSRHDGRKGIDVLIDALERLRDRQVPFRSCLVGPGLLLQTHRREIRARGLEDRVVLPGRVPDVMPYLRAADVYVLPSLQEGSGSVALLEALQAGAAIIASEVDGIPEDIRHEHDALMVPPGDPVALEAAIVRLIGDHALRERLGAAARRTYETRFALPVMGRELASLYAELGLPAPV